MALKSRSQAARGIAYLRYLWWQVALRHPEYCADLDRLMRTWQETVGPRRPRRGVISKVIQPAPPASEDLATPDEDPSPLFASLAEIRPPDPECVRVQRVHDALNLYRAMCHVATHECSDVCAPYLGSARIDLPELNAFETRWGLRFPVPSHARGTPARLMCAPITHPVRIVSESPSAVVLEVLRPMGRAVLDYVAGILDNYQDHRDEVLPPVWSLERIDHTVRAEFLASTSDQDWRDEVLEYQDWLAREAGYRSYADVRRAATRVAADCSAAETEQLRVAETAAAKALWQKAGIPPRVAVKGGATGTAMIDAHDADHLRVTLFSPESIDYARLASQLKTYLTPSRLHVRMEDEPAHRRMFEVIDLARQRLTAAEIAQAMDLDDAEARGPERVATLKKAYRALVRSLALPALP